jgi:hypothetical protein
MTPKITGAQEARANDESNDAIDTASPNVHDGVYSPIDVMRHCEQMRAEIAARQKNLVDVPV